MENWDCDYGVEAFILKVTVISFGLAEMTNHFKEMVVSGNIAQNNERGPD